MSPQLRPYQQQLVTDVRNAWAAGHRNVLMRLDTGGGKTVTLGNLVESEPGASCVIAHRSELVGQLSVTLARYGVRHDLIASDATKRTIAALHVSELGRCYLTPGARCKVASVDTLVRRTETIRQWASTVGLWVVDECFPAGTIVDGKPIDTIQVGDTVTAFNEETGGFERRQVTHLFKTPAPNYMMRVAFGSRHVVHCTFGHPFWTKRGWVKAVDLTDQDEVLVHEMHVLRQRGRQPDRSCNVQVSKDWSNLLQQGVWVRRSRTQSGSNQTQSDCISDLLRVWEGNRCRGVETFAHESDGASLLQQSMLKYLPVANIFYHDDPNEPDLCVTAGSNEQPYGASRGSCENQCCAQSDGTQTTGSWWQRQTVTHGREVDGFVDGTGVQSAICRADTHGSKVGISDVLQDRRCEPGLDVGDRSRRAGACRVCEEGTGPEEGSVSHWSRVDRVEIYKRADQRYADERADDGYVYNIEVEGLHTYIADGVVVHNCAHLVTDNKWHKAIGTFTRPDVRGLGPTATPVRADGKGLGAPEHGGDGVFNCMVEGPPMRWLIDQGYLAEYRVVCVESDLKLLEEDVSASGDWSPSKLRDASRKSHIVGDIVATYRKWAPGMLTMTFCTDVETAIEVTKAFNDAGIPAATLTGETEDRLRAQMLRQFEKREILQLVSVDVVSEGFDLPALEAVQLARPTQSLGLFRQQVGRALRPKPDGSKALIIDHVGNFLRHGPPDRPVQWSLARRDKRSKGVSDAIPLRVCVECYQPYERIHPACPYCGHEPEPVGRSSPEMVDGDLAELSPEVLERLRAAVAVVDRSVTEVRDHYERIGLPELAVRGQIKQHNERVRAQEHLRDAIAAWGVARCAEGLDQRQRQRLFFHTYGVDVLSARALGRAEAEALLARIK